MKNMLEKNQMFIFRVLGNKKMTVHDIFKNICIMSEAFQDKPPDMFDVYSGIKTLMKYGYIVDAKLSSTNQKAYVVYHISKTGKDAYIDSKNKWLAIFGMHPI